MCHKKLTQRSLWLWKVIQRVRLKKKFFIKCWFPHKCSVFFTFSWDFRKIAKKGHLINVPLAIFWNGFYEYFSLVFDLCIQITVRINYAFRYSLLLLRSATFQRTSLDCHDFIFLLWHLWLWCTHSSLYPVHFPFQSSSSDCMQWFMQVFNKADTHLCRFHMSQYGLNDAKARAVLLTFGVCILVA